MHTLILLKKLTIKNMNLVENHFLVLENWRNIPMIIFIMVKMIKTTSNMHLVVNFYLMLEIWGPLSSWRQQWLQMWTMWFCSWWPKRSFVDTSIQFMMAKKITNIPHVQRHFLMQEIWRHISILFTMAKRKKMMFMADTIMEKMTLSIFIAFWLYLLTL